MHRTSPAQRSRQPAGRTSTASLTAHPRHTQSHTLGHWTPHSEHAQGSLRADHTTEERGREEDAHTQRARDAWQRRSCGIRHCHIGRCMHHTAGSFNWPIPGRRTRQVPERTAAGRTSHDVRRRSDGTTHSHIFAAPGRGTSHFHAGRPAVLAVLARAFSSGVPLSPSRLPPPPLAQLAAACRGS